MTTLPTEVDDSSLTEKKFDPSNECLADASFERRNEEQDISSELSSDGEQLEEKPVAEKCPVTKVEEGKANAKADHSMEKLLKPDEVKHSPAKQIKSPPNVTVCQRSAIGHPYFPMCYPPHLFANSTSAFHHPLNSMFFTSPSHSPLRPPLTSIPSDDQASLTPHPVFAHASPLSLSHQLALAQRYQSMGAGYGATSIGPMLTSRSTQRFHPYNLSPMSSYSSSGSSNNNGSPSPVSPNSPLSSSPSLSPIERTSPTNIVSPVPIRGHSVSPNSA